MFDPHHLAGLVGNIGSQTVHQINHIVFPGGVNNTERRSLLASEVIDARTHQMMFPETARNREYGVDIERGLLVPHVAFTKCQVTPIVELPAERPLLSEPLGNRGFESVPLNVPARCRLPAEVERRGSVGAQAIGKIGADAVRNAVFIKKTPMERPPLFGHVQNRLGFDPAFQHPVVRLRMMQAAVPIIECGPDYRVSGIVPPRKHRGIIPVNVLILSSGEYPFSASRYGQGIRLPCVRRNRTHGCQIKQ